MQLHSSEILSILFGADRRLGNITDRHEGRPRWANIIAKELWGRCSNFGLVRFGRSMHVSDLSNDPIYWPYIESLLYLNNEWIQVKRRKVESQTVLGMVTTFIVEPSSGLSVDIPFLLKPLLIYWTSISLLILSQISKLYSLELSRRLCLICLFLLSGFASNLDVLVRSLPSTRCSLVVVVSFDLERNRIAFVHLGQIL